MFIKSISNLLLSYEVRHLYVKSSFAFTLELYASDIYMFVLDIWSQKNFTFLKAVIILATSLLRCWRQG